MKYMNVQNVGVAVKYVNVAEEYVQIAAVQVFAARQVSFGDMCVVIVTGQGEKTLNITMQNVSGAEVMVSCGQIIHV